jgi:hypothetical protein
MSARPLHTAQKQRMPLRCPDIGRGWQTAVAGERRDTIMHREMCDRTTDS